MRKKLMFLLVVFVLFGCSSAPYYKEDTVVIKDCSVKTDNQVNRLKTTIQHEVKGEYALIYSSNIFLDDDLNFDLQSLTNIDIELVKQGKVIESPFTLPKENLMAYSEITGDQVVDLIANVSYSSDQKDTFTLADSIRLKFTKTDGGYTAELLPVATN